MTPQNDIDGPVHWSLRLSAVLRKSWFVLLFFALLIAISLLSPKIPQSDWTWFPGAVLLISLAICLWGPLLWLAIFFVIAVRRLGRVDVYLWLQAASLTALAVAVAWMVGHE